MSAFSEESLQLRRELAYARRILAANGQNDTIYGHVTYREAGATTFWMKPAALGLDEITPETLIRVDLEGNVVEGELPRHLEFPIHTEIFRARPKHAQKNVDLLPPPHWAPVRGSCFCSPCGAVHEGRDFLERALAKSEGVEVPVRAKALQSAVDLALIQDDIDRAESLCVESLQGELG